MSISGDNNLASKQSVSKPDQLCLHGNTDRFTPQIQNSDWRRWFQLAMVVFLWMGVPMHLKTQNSSSAINILGIEHSITNVSIHWQGGFPPYRVRVSKGLDSAWTEYPNLIQNTNFTTPAGLISHFFQVRTEFAPIRLTRIQRDGGLVYLNWTGGIPPYRVQSLRLPGSDWQDLPHSMIGKFHASFAADDYSFYRVRSESDTNAPATPKALSALTVQCTRAVLSWESAEDEPMGSGLFAYNLYRNGVIVKQLAAPTNFVFDTELAANTSFDYRVSAVDRAGNESARSSVLTVTTPTCPDGETNGSRLVLKWDRSEEPTIAGYIVHWGFEPGAYLWQIDVMRSTTATIDGLESGVPYFFAITAYDFGGTESEPSNKVTHIPP